VIVERYITAKRAFRFLTAPINSSTNIRANWMENTNNTTSVNINPVPGYGTHISGVGGGTNGFDFTNTNNPSLFKFNFANQSFIPVTNTNGTFSAGQPFRILIRGDRSINLGLNAPEPTPTTLRAKGVLATGTFKLTKAGGGGSPNMPELSTIDSAFNFVANPYASPIDWDLLDRTNITSTLTIFDGSINFRGAYVNYNALTGTNGISNVDNHIQSGQAFMVQTAGPNPSLTFKESYKTTEHRAVFRTGATLPRIVVQLLMPQQGSQATAVDAFAAYFSNDFDSSIGDEDSRKLSNQDENIAILRNGKLLSIEGRKPVSGKDTLPVRLWQLTRKDYSFRVAITNFEENVNSYVFDNYLQTLEKCKNNDVTVLPFSINNDTASFATNRFKIVFQNFSTLPVTLAGVKAYPKNKGVQVEWTTQSESNMAKYEVETSSNAQQFTTKGTVPAQANATGSAYSWFDASPFNGDNYYRIKAISKSGEITYSEVVKVNISNNEKKGSVQFVSASANTINFKLNNIEKGRYAVSLLNSGGQKVYSASLTTSAGSANEVINLKNLLSAGIYHLQLSSPQNTYNVPVIIP
jgi:hypothetical protein